MSHRNFLYLLRPGGGQGELREIGEWFSIFPSLWRILLADGAPAAASDVRSVLAHEAVHCIVADAGRALQRYSRVVQFLHRHPHIDEVEGLRRYLDGALQYLSDAAGLWVESDKPAPMFGANFEELARRRESSPEEVAREELAQSNELWRSLEHAMRAEDFAALGSVLRFPAWNLQFTDWKAWAGVFGLALLDHKYFTHAFREPLDGEYLDFEYDDLGSGDFLGNDRYRYRENGKWGVRTSGGNAVLAAQWDRVLRAGEGETELVWLRRGHSFGLAAIAGKHEGHLLLAPSLDEVHSFIDGVAVARRENKMGFLARDGAWHVEPVWDEVCEYSNGYAVMLSADRFGYLDAAGSVAIAAQFDEADDFNFAAVARIRLGRHCGLIRGDGSFALPVECTRLEWSQQCEGWICIRNGSTQLLRADASRWIDDGWDAIEPCVPRHCLCVKRDGRVGLLQWSGEPLLACEYDELQPRCVAGLDASPIEFIARRGYRRGLIDERGQLLVPFEYSAIESLEPHFASGGALTKPELVRVRTMPGEGRPRVGVWNIPEQRFIVPCIYEYIWMTLLGNDAAYGFIVATRNLKRGESVKGRHILGILSSRGSSLVPHEYAWIAEPAMLNDVTAMDEMRDTLHLQWGRGEAVRAVLSENGVLVRLLPIPMITAIVSG